MSEEKRWNRALGHLKQYENMDICSQKFLSNINKSKLTLKLRDDSYILNPLPLSQFNPFLTHRGIVLHKNCLSWTGVNDKHFIVFNGNESSGLNSMKKMYKNFPKQKDILNPESFLKWVWDQEKIEVVEVSPEILPILTSYTDGEQTCFSTLLTKVGENMECVPQNKREFVRMKSCKNTQQLVKIK